MNAHGYLDRVICELKALDSPQKNTLVSVLQYLSDHIRVTRDEICALRTGNSGGPLFSTTADELEEIVTETALAANRIMDAAEMIERAAAGAEPSLANILTDAVTNIYEASAFQDITGQRIAKIVGALQAMEINLASLVAAFGPPEDGGTAAAREGDAALLNGPQLEKNASNQTDIDALFESLG
ncbi:MAG: protein phosphatase CheZ [Bradyrhizobium sp.]|nr:protein phosphatase CheZ [Bradyrhizobium sp.]